MLSGGLSDVKPIISLWRRRLIPSPGEAAMPFDAIRVLYSAKDLVNFLGCPHCSALDLMVRGGAMGAPGPPQDEFGDLLKEKGVAHERRYLETLRSEGKAIRS